MEEKNSVSFEERNRYREIIKAREPEVNIYVAKSIIKIILAIYAIFIAFVMFGGYELQNKFLIVTFLVMPLLTIVFCFLCIKKNGVGNHIKYDLFICMTMMLFFADMLSGINSKLVITIPLILTMRYYDKKVMYRCAAVTIAFLLLGCYLNSYHYNLTETLDLNAFWLEESTIINTKEALFDNLIATQPDSWTLFRRDIFINFIPDTFFVYFVVKIMIRIMEKNLIIISDLNESVKELTEAQTKIVLSQVKPHFIYNTLTSIARLCDKDPAKAKSLTMDFSGYLRGNLDNLGSEEALCTFDSELEHIRSYLNIELVRFEDTLKVEYDIKEKDFIVPTLSVQPLVENAVKHGIRKKEDGGTVKISTELINEEYVITVEDDGAGYDVTKKPDDTRNHVGIENTRKRLMMHGNRMTIDSAPGKGTTVKIYILKEEEKTC